MKLSEAIGRYIAKIRRGGMAPVTIEAYDRHLALFAAFTGDVETDNITKDTIEKYEESLAKRPNVNASAAMKKEAAKKYQDYLAKRLKLKPSDRKKAGEAPPKWPLVSKSTRWQYLSTLRELLKYCRKMEIPCPEPEMVELPKKDERRNRFVENDKIQQLLDMAARHSKDPFINARDRAIIETLYFTGVRVSEMINLNRDNLDHGRRQVTIKGKGNKHRTIYFPESTLMWITKYLGMRKDTSPALFVSSKMGKTGDDKGNERLTRQGAYLIVKGIAKAAALNSSDISPHVMRHSFATEALRVTNNLHTVKDLLGHKYLSTTDIYAHNSNKTLDEAHGEVFGRGSLELRSEKVKRGKRSYDH